MAKSLRFPQGEKNRLGVSPTVEAPLRQIFSRVIGCLSRRSRIGCARCRRSPLGTSIHRISSGMALDIRNPTAVSRGRGSGKGVVSLEAARIIRPKGVFTCQRLSSWGSGSPDGESSSRYHRSRKSPLPKPRRNTGPDGPCSSRSSCHRQVPQKGRSSGILVASRDRSPGADRGTSRSP